MTLRRVLWVMCSLGAAAASACLTIDPFFFNGRAVDGYDFDADPPDPDLEGELEPAHPSRVPPEARVEGRLDLGDREVHYVYAHRADAAATVLFSHGTTWHLGRYWDRAEALWERGLNVMIYDYPGYGLSTGEPAEAELFENAAAVLELLPTLPDYTPDRLALYGYSLGGAPTYELAARGARGEAPRADAVITEAAFCSSEAMIQDGTFIDMPGSFLTNNPFDNCARIAELTDVPVLILHGGADSFVVPRHAEMLEAAATGEVTVRIVPGADHSECALVGGEAYWQWIVDFAAGAP
ncbi:MAG: alpha/beta hydrolase [Nannocystaceae bacterium]